MPNHKKAEEDRLGKNIGVRVKAKAEKEFRNAATSRNIGPSRLGREAFEVYLQLPQVLSRIARGVVEKERILKNLVSALGKSEDLTPEAKKAYDEALQSIGDPLPDSLAIVLAEIERAEQGHGASKISEDKRLGLLAKHFYLNGEAVPRTINTWDEVTGEWKTESLLSDIPAEEWLSTLESALAWKTFYTFNKE